MFFSRFLAHNVDCGGASNDYSQSMFQSKNKKINPNLTILKSGVRGSSLHGHVNKIE